MMAIMVCFLLSMNWLYDQMKLITTNMSCLTPMQVLLLNMFMLSVLERNRLIVVHQDSCYNGSKAYSTVVSLTPKSKILTFVLESC